MTVIDIRDGVEEMQNVVKKRDDILAEIDDRWLNDCHGCTLISDAVQKGELTKGTTRSSRNPICDACPVHSRIQELGRELDENIREHKVARREVRSRFGQNQFTDMQWEPK